MRYISKLLAICFVILLVTMTQPVSAKTMSVTTDTTWSSDFVEDMSGVTVVVKSGAVLRLAGIKRIESDLLIENGGHVRVEQDCSLSGVITVEKNDFSAAPILGNKVLKINGDIKADRWQVFGEGLQVEGDIAVNEIYPEWWHGKGDDWSAAINAAIKFVEQDGNKAGPTISFASKIYNVADSLRISGSGVRLVGTGRGRAAGSTSLIYGGTALFYTGAKKDEKAGLISTADGKKNNNRNVVVKDISLLCDEKISGIVCEYTNICQFQNIYIDRPIVGMSFENGSYSNLIDSVEVYDPIMGGMDFRANCHSVTVSNCIFNGVRTGDKKPKYGIRIAHVSNCSDMTIFGSNFDYYRVADHVILKGNDCRGFNFVGNYIEVRNDGISDSALTLYNGSGINVAGNRFTTSSKVSGYNINLGSECEGVSITGNYFRGAKNACIKMAAGARNVFVAGNEVAGNTRLMENQSIKPEDQNSCYIENGDIVADSIKTGKTVMNNGGIITIAKGEITVTGSLHSVRTEAGAASDELVTIKGGQDGQLLVLQAAKRGQTVVVKDGGTGKNPVRLNSKSFELNHPQDKLVLINIAGYWHEVSRSDNL